jgi:orotidine-5'-phosphate decarboxylase
MSSSAGTSSEASFRERLRRRIAAVGNALCVGIDPPLPAAAAATGAGASFVREQLALLGAEGFLTRYANALVDVAAEHASSVKLQSAFFEAYGVPGVSALAHVLERARSLGLITLLDAKRGDIASTMAAYGHAAFESMKADALTITPYLGLDVLEPLVPWLQRGHGVYVVWVSSNPAGALLQEATVEHRGREVVLAEMLLDEIVKVSGRLGIEGAVGLVLGATKLDQLPPTLVAKARAHPLLLPGVGPQGGKVDPTLLATIAGGTSLVPLQRGLAAFPEDGAAPLTWSDFSATLFDRARSYARSLRIGDALA